ncbi:unnamed protein product, partial [Ectocarpus fasciculatus]
MIPIALLAGGELCLFLASATTAHVLLPWVVYENQTNVNVPTCRMILSFHAFCVFRGLFDPSPLPNLNASEPAWGDHLVLSPHGLRHATKVEGLSPSLHPPPSA